MLGIPILLLILERIDEPLEMMGKSLRNVTRQQVKTGGYITLTKMVSWVTDRTLRRSSKPGQWCCELARVQLICNCRNIGW